MTGKAESAEKDRSSQHQVPGRHEAVKNMTALVPHRPPVMCQGQVIGTPKKWAAKRRAGLRSENRGGKRRRE